MTGAHGDNGGIGNVVTIKATARDDAADSSDDAALDQVDGNLSSSWTFSKPNTNQLNNDAVGTITAAEVSQTQA